MMRGPAPARDESGAIAIVTAITMVVLILMAAYVTDLGFARYDRVANKAVADMAAAGATVGFEPSSADGPARACQEALALADANIVGANFADDPGAPDCNVVFSSICDPAVVRTATFTGENGYVLEITIPVPDDPTLPKFELLEGLDHGTWDGVPCERVGVEITHAPLSVFRGLTGAGGREITQSTVGRSRLSGTAAEYATLVVLQRDGCNTIDVSGTTRVRVMEWEGVDDEDNPRTLQGNLTVDTRQQGCPGSGYVLNTQGNNSFISASGDIVAFNLTQTPSNRTFDPAKTGNVDTFQLSPIPRPGSRITRAPVDHLINCKTTYPTGQPWSPTFTGYGTAASTVPAQPILPCGEGPTAPMGDPPPPYIENLRAALQGVRASDIPIPGTNPASPWADWAVWPRDVVGLVPGVACNNAVGTYGPTATRPPNVSGRNWYIDCERTPANSVFTPNTTTGINFVNVHNVVSRNWVEMSGGGRLRIQGDPARGAVFYLQAANNERTQGVNQNPGLTMTSSGQLRLEGVVVYSDWGPVDVVGSAGSMIIWETPPESAEVACEGYSGGLPPAGCMRPLTLWSNSHFQHRLGGQSTLDIGGVFFTPNANKFNLSGQSDQFLDRAQFFTYALELSGGARIDMRPNPDTNIGIPLRGSGLIR